MLIRWLDPSLDYTKFFWNLIVTNVAMHMLLLLTKMNWSLVILLRCGDPSLDHTENILNLIVTNVAIAHVTIAHEDEKVKAHSDS